MWKTYKHSSPKQPYTIQYVMENHVLIFLLCWGWGFFPLSKKSSNSIFSHSMFYQRHSTNPDVKTSVFCNSLITHLYTAITQLSIYQLCGKSYFCFGGNPIVTLNPISIQANIFTGTESKTKAPLLRFLETFT